MLSDKICITHPMPKTLKISFFNFPHFEPLPSQGGDFLTTMSHNKLSFGT